MGGRATVGEYAIGCSIDEKAFYQKDDRLPNDYKIIVGYDGYFPLEIGDRVSMFAHDESGFLEDKEGPVYYAAGDYEGKLYLQNNGTYTQMIPAQNNETDYARESLTISIEQLEKMIG